MKQANKWGIKFIWDMCYGRWASEALFNEEVQIVRHLYQVDDISAPQWGYTMDRFTTDMLYMLLIGFIYRVVAFILLVLLNWHKTDSALHLRGPFGKVFNSLFS